MTHAALQTIQKLKSLKGQLQYTNDQLSKPGMADWERKEYKALADQYTEEIADLQAHIEDNKQLFK